MLNLFSRYSNRYAIYNLSHMSTLITLIYLKKIFLQSVNFINYDFNALQISIIYSLDFNLII